MDEIIVEKLKKLVLEGGFLSEEQLKTAVDEATKTGSPLENILVERDFIPSEHMGQLISQINKWQFVQLSKQGVDEAACKLIPEKVARKQNVMAFEQTPDSVRVAMNNPNDTTLIHLLEKTLGKKVIPSYAGLADIKEHFSIYKSEIREEFEKIIKVEADKTMQGEAKESATIQVVDMLLIRGYESKASDIHIEPQEENTIIRFRIDGVMQEIISVPKSIHDLLISRIKVMSHLRTDEHQTPQDGKLQFNSNNETVDVRVSIVPTTKGENAVMRILAEKSGAYTLDKLGLSKKDFEKLNRAIKKPWGMILATGPTGSGKTTALYSILKILNTKEVNIATIEDPVEYNNNGITQIQVNPKAELTFSAGLKSIVRQDPDIIMVGEIRDKETASIAVNSGMTGHLVLSTLHTNDAATTLPRILDMGIEPFLVASTVNIAIGQRLVRTICPKCIQSYETTAAELSKKIPKDVLEKIAQGKTKVTLYKGAGCDLCQHTGYHGRTGVFELLEIDDDIRELIIQNSDADTIKAKAVEKGMTTMFDDAREKVINGITTIEEMLRTIKG